MFLAEAHADGVGSAVRDEWIAGGKAIKNRGGVLGNLGWREAEARRDDGIDLEAGRWPADGVLDAVLDIDDALDLFDGIADARAELTKQGRIVYKKLDLDWLRRIGEVANHVLQHLRKFNVEFRLGCTNLRADIVNDFVDGPAAFGFQLDSEIASVGFGHGGKAHLQAGAARGALHFRSCVKDALYMLKDAIGFGERTACGHDVVEDETALVHLRKQVRAECLITKPRGNDQQHTGATNPQRLGE